MHSDTMDVSELIAKTARIARQESPVENKPHYTRTPLKWPLNLTVGPGLEGAIACETKVGYVNGTDGSLTYRGYDIFELCEHSSFEEVSYLLLKGRLPTEQQLTRFDRRLKDNRALTDTIRLMMSFPLEEMNTMAGLRLGVNLMRQKLTWRDKDEGRPETSDAIAADEDSIAEERVPTGEKNAIYEFRLKKREAPKSKPASLDSAETIDSCIRLISGLATIAAAVSRVRQGKLPIEPDPELGHAANFLYMLTGKRPSAEEARIMDVCLILHADHGMNASTFASMVVASTMSDIYFSIGSGIAALNGPLHGGANEQVVKVLRRIGSRDNVDAFVDRAIRRKEKIMGFGHRVYKVYDPRARVLGPLALDLARSTPAVAPLFKTAQALEKRVIAEYGEKGIFPNVDFYSGLVYTALGIPEEMFTPVFAISRVAGWTARVSEYLRKNRIFRPRAAYTGAVDLSYVHISQRHKSKPRARKSVRRDHHS